MKKISIVFVLAAVALFSSQADAFHHRRNVARAWPVTSGLMVVPYPGVTTRELSQERINWISANMTRSYEAGIAAANARYEASMNAVNMAPETDESAEPLNEMVANAMAQRELDFQVALVDAAREAARNCQRLCYVIANGVRYE